MNEDSSLRPIHHFATLDLQDLGRLATLWRLQALRGNPWASTIARAFEAEQRRRYRAMGSGDAQGPAARPDGS